MGGESKADDYAIGEHSREERQFFICSLLCVLENVPLGVCPISRVSISRPAIKKASGIFYRVFISWIIHDFDFSICARIIAGRFMCHSPLASASAKVFLSQRAFVKLSAALEFISLSEHHREHILTLSTICQWIFIDYF